jgi:hypothetical protein
MNKIELLKAIEQMPDDAKVEYEYDQSKDQYDEVRSIRFDEVTNTIRLY